MWAQHKGEGGTQSGWAGRGPREDRARQGEAGPDPPSRPQEGLSLRAPESQARSRKTGRPRHRLWGLCLKTQPWDPLRVPRTPARLQPQPPGHSRAPRRPAVASLGGR